MWRFGDGKSTTGGLSYKTISHRYTTAGNYTVTLEVKDKVGKPVLATKDITVNAINHAPTAAIISVSSNPAAVGQSIIFTGVITDEDGRNEDIDKVMWDFKDGTIIDDGDLDDSLTLYTYYQPCTYEVSFKAIDKSGASAEDTRTVIIKPRQKSQKKPLTID